LPAEKDRCSFQKDKKKGSPADSEKKGSRLLKCFPLLRFADDPLLYGFLGGFCFAFH
jgi:hypothetical protein